MEFRVIEVLREYILQRTLPERVKSIPNYKNHITSKPWLFEPEDFFTDITGLVLMLTPDCNFKSCGHCGTEYNNFKLGDGYSIMRFEEALSLSEMITTAQQFTISGGELFLLDSDVREYALERDLIDQQIYDKFKGHDYLSNLVEILSQKLRDSWNVINQIRPDVGGYRKERFLRVPTNGFLLPWMENIDLDDEKKIRESLLYKVLRKYRGINLQLSIGPFQQIEYLRNTQQLSDSENLTMERRMEELLVVSHLLQQDFAQEFPGEDLYNFTLGFMYTFCKPNNSPATDSDWKKMQTVLEENSIIRPCPIHNPNESEIFIMAEKSYRSLELQQVIGLGNATKLPCGVNYRFDEAPSKHLSIIDELYAVPLPEGGIMLFDNTISYYSLNRDKRIMKMGFFP